MPKIKILVVDDSAVVRGMISRIIQEDPDIEISGSASNGEIAIKYYQQERPDIVLLDIQMPIMDGIEALKRLIAHDKDAKIIMCSTLTHQNAEISMEALQLGAVDYIPKPESASEINSSAQFKETLLRMIHNIVDGPAKKMAGAGNTKSQKEEKPVPASVPSSLRGDITKRESPPASWRPRIVAIGSSTGGPQALFKVVKNLQNLRVPIVITQHMPATFTKILAQHLCAQTGIECAEGEDGMVLETGKVYIAPGGKHMLFEKEGLDKVTVKLDDGPMENFCKPAVDPMLRSLIDIYGDKILFTMLTGMGSDGLEGCKALIQKKGYLIAQDAETSVVWGMPGAVAKEGLCSEVLPVEEIGPWVKSKVS